jgi:hypothetical protein
MAMPLIFVKKQKVPCQEKQAQAVPWEKIQVEPFNIFAYSVRDRK